MRKLTSEQLHEAFPMSKFDMMDTISFYAIVQQAQEDDGIDIRYVLEQVGTQPRGVSVFVEKILLASDLDDVLFVIDKIISEKKDDDVFAIEAIRKLRAWVAKTSMINVIKKREGADRCVT